MNHLMVVVVPLVCAKAPPGAQKPTDQITSYLLWGLGILFLLAVVCGLGAVAAGRMFAMPHASKAGVVSLVVVFACVLGFLVVPPIISAMYGDGCLGPAASPAATPAATPVATLDAAAPAVEARSHG